MGGLERRILVLALLVFGLASPVEAALLCGTVRDATTLLPVPRAGVFLRTPAGAYTGLHAASNVSGEFCVDPVPPGTYDLQVLVDDYQVAYVRGVVVADDVTGVEVNLGEPGLLLQPPWPNPSRGPVTIEFQLSLPGPVQLTIYDVRGRLVHGWESELPAGAHSVTWEFTDRAAHPLPAGRYFVRLVTDAGTAVRSLLRVR